MRPAAALLLALAAAPALAAPASESAAAPRTAVDLERKIEEADIALARLSARARVPFQVERIRGYRAMGPQQLADLNRGTTVDELLRYVSDEATTPEIREEAAQALVAEVALRCDPDLSTEGRGLKRPRAVLSLKVLPLLTDKDLHSRSLGKSILESLWPGYPARDPDIARYDARKKDTWWEARRGWEKQLKR